MTRKVTRKPSSFRVAALFVGVLTLSIGFAALAQMTRGRPSGRPRLGPVKAAASSQALGTAVLPGATDFGRGTASDLQTKQHRAMDSNPPLFLPTVAYDSGAANAIAVAVADVNSDNKPDLLVVNDCANNTCSKSSLGVLRGKGDGTFEMVANHRSIGSHARALAVADLNGDGKPDVVVNNLFGSVVFVLLGTGDGNFQLAVPYSSGGIFPEAIAIADVNGDGKPDLLVTNDAGNYVNGNPSDLTVSVLLGNGDGTFQAPATYDPGGTDVFSIAVADVNGDGKPDLAVAIGCAGGNCANPGAIGVLMGNGDGTFQSALNYASGANDPVSVAVGDVNGDGKPDVLVGNGSGSVGVLLGNGDGTFQPAVTYSSGGGQSIRVADVNGDGKPDLLMVTGGSVIVLLGNGDGTFQVPITFDSGGTFAASLVVADLNRDGKPDLAVANQVGCSPCGRGSVGVLLKNTEATTTVVTTSGSPSFVGQSVTFTATVTSGHGTIPDGELVTFFDGRTEIGTGATAGGVAAFSTSSLVWAKTHTIKATYAGDAAFKPSTGSVTQVVERYPSTTTLTSNRNPSHFGQAVKFTAHVTGTGPSTPTGLVKFLDGTTGIGSATLTGGTANLTRSNLAVGTHPITAQYLGDAFSAKSTSNVVNQVVQ